MRSWRWLAILAPALVGLVINLLISQGNFPNPVFYLRADLGVLAFLLGVLLSILAGIGLVIWNRSEQIRLDADLQAAAERRRFLQRLDHEMKNPLTAIMVGLANLSARLTDQDDQASLHAVQTQVQRLRLLVSDLRKLSDLETREIEQAPVDVGLLLEDVMAVVQEQPGAAERKLALSVPQAPWPLPSVTGDRDLLFLAVLNLADNAIKFSQPGDRIELRAVEDGSEVLIEVADTGPGIPPEEADQVWEELYRGEKARGISGSGLGLALVRAIATRHGGRVNLRSRPEQGTMIILRLPANEAARSP